MATFETVAEHAQAARRMAEELSSSDQSPAVRALALATVELADELDALLDAIRELGGRLEAGPEN